jgi:putative inorganic carbon (hco3(-)) transporter
VSTATLLSRTDHGAEENRVLARAIILAGVAATPLLALASVEQPGLLLVAVAVVAAATICVLRVEIALLALVATVPLEGAIRISSNPQLSLTKLVGALCFVSFVLFALVQHRRLHFDITHVLVFLLLALAAVSTLQAREIGEAMATTVRYGSFVALYVIVSQLGSDGRLQRRIAWTLTAASAVAGFIAINNFIAGEYPQASLPYTNQNDTAFVLATTLPFTFWLLGSRGLRKAAALTMIGVIAAAIVLSFSRGALVGLAAAAVWYLVTEHRRIWMFPVGALVALVATLGFIQLNPGNVQTGYQQKQRIAQYNVESRLEAWSAAIDLTEKKPLLGVGPGNFREYFFEETGRPPGTNNLLVVHNAYLDVAAEVGLLAASVFLLYMVLTMLRANTVRRLRVGLPGFATAVNAAFVVAAVSSLFLSEQYFAPIWLLGGIATALWHTPRRAAAAA